MGDQRFNQQSLIQYKPVCSFEMGKLTSLGVTFILLLMVHIHYTYICTMYPTTYVHTFIQS